MSSRALLHVVVASLFCHSAFADSAIEPLVGFEMGPGNPGGAPLFLHPNGNFYATSAMGGAFGYTNFSPIRIGYGTIFQVRPSGEVGGLSFSNALGSIPGDTPNSNLVLSSDGWLWGSTTKGAPAESNGTVFRIHPDTGTFQTIYNVSGGGTNPVSNLVRDPATGRLWGTAGATSFSIDELTGAYTAGVAPTINTSEVDDGAGFRWGITAAGGTSGNGTIYKTEIANSTTTTVVNFSGTTGSFQGKTPLGPLVKDGGFLWGVTKEGGSGTSPGLGVIFKLEIATGTYTAVVRFGSLTGVNAGMNTPSNALAADGKGYLWGFASPGVANGANGWSLYKIKTSDGSLTRVSEYGPGTNNTVLTALNNAAAPKGRMPYKGLTGSATSPYLWGTTSEGGTKGFGTLFRYDPSTRHFEVMVNFTGTTGAALGGRANGRLHIDENGAVWGTTEVGGTGNSGTVFKFDPDTRTFTTIHSFNLGGNGGFPRSGLVDGGDGFLWGTASSSPNGVIYRVNKSTNALGVAYAFPSSPTTEGATPEGELLLDGSGNLWGTTTGGGTSGNGVLYKFVPSTLTYTAMVKFSGADTAPNSGRQPSGPLVMDNSGNIWGTTIYNVFKYAPGSSTYTNVFNYNENTLALPVKSVSVGTISKTAAGNIRFLGTEGTKELTTSGDTARMSYRAVVYEINPATNVTTKLHSLMEAGAGLAGPADLSPAGGLYEHTDGRFYGITKNSGVDEDMEPAGGGMIYRVSTGPAVMTQPYWTPTVTNFYTLVSNNTATLRGYANPNGNTITCEFEWGPTTAFGNTATGALSSGVGGSGNAGSIFSASLSDLTANTTYFYRFLAKTATGEPSYGPVRSFVTGAQASFPSSAEIRVESPIGQSLTDNVGSLDLGQLLVGQSFKQAVVIRNLSAAASLTGLSASISGGDASDFVITRPLSAASLAGTASDALLITFTPSGAGTRTTTLTITSNDADEASFEVILTGEGLLVPDIVVEDPAAANLESGNGYNFGSRAINSDTDLTFTIRNTGNADLTGLDVNLVGAHAPDFAVTTYPDATVAAGGSTTFIVTFTPSAGGMRNAQLEISSNDSDENPFYIQLSGTGVTAPEIEVLDDTIELADNASTIDFDSVDTGSLSTRVITIRNAGSAALTGISLSFFGGDTTQFQVGTVASSVSAGGTTTFNLRFSPQTAGAKTTTLRIASNDSDENPFDISVTGTGVTGSVDVLGITKTRIFSQTGTSTVVANNFSMSAFIEGTGLNANFPSSSNRFTPAGGSATALTFDSTDSAWYQEAFFATQTLLNSSFPNGNYSFQIGSDSVALSLPSDAYPNTPVVTSDAGLWVNGRLQVTPEQAAAGFNLTTNVSNGDGFLSMEIFSETTDVLSEFITENPQLNQRMDVAVPAGALVEGTIYTLEAEFDEVVSSPALSFPWAANTGRGFGLFSSKTVFEIEVVPADPEIQVEHPAATQLADGSASLTFGTLNPGTTGAAKVITVKNTGTGLLNLAELNVDGSEASEFTVSSTDTNFSLAPGESTTFSVTFTPGALGSRSAALHIISDDADEGSFDINLSGTGASFPQAPVFTVQPQSRLVLLGDPVVFATTVIGDPVMTYKWKKGTALIPKASTNTYGIAVTKASDAGAYSIIADNPVGPEVPSQTAYLGLVTPSNGTQVLKVGSNLSLKCTVARPTSPRVVIGYTWSRVGDTMPVSGGTTVVSNNATAGTLGITKIRTADAGTYTCLVTLDDLDTPGIDATLSHGEMVVRVVDAVPDVDAVSPLSVSVSEPINITITATNYPTSFSATGLPAGLKFDTRTGRLTGKPTVASKQTLGVYSPSIIKFKATNPFGTSGEESFLLTIEPLEAGVVGTFSGLVARSGHSNFGMGGHVKVTVASTGIVTGDVTLAGQKHSVVGSLNVSLRNNPTFDLIVKRTPASLGELSFSGNISPADDLLTGTITDEEFEMLNGMIDLGDPDEPDLIDGPLPDARFNSPHSIALRADNGGYVSDTGNHVIRFVDPEVDEISTYAGNATAGSDDGTGAAASFNGPEGIVLDASGNLYVADTGNSTIRKITPAGVVTTFAGQAGQVGSTNGTGAAARFSEPCALCFDPAGNLIVVDRGNHLIRRITPAGVVTTLAGKADVAGHKDGAGTAALFDTPRGITYDPALKALFVTDTGNRVIRRVTLAGAVTTYAGSPGVEGADEGLFANTRFIEPIAIVSLGDGTLVVGDILLIQLNTNGTTGVISEMLDTITGTDHPVGIAYNEVDDGLIVAHDTLHCLASYESSGLPLEDALVSATRNPWSAASNVPLSQQGLYNAAIETTVDPSDASFPQGSGYAQVSISKTGTANWTGKAADGTSFTFSTFLDADLHIPLHVSMYRNTGSLQGDTFIDPATQDLVNHSTPAFDWYKIPQPLSSTDRSYKSGFPLHELTLTGGKYTPNDLHGYLGLSSSPAPMKLDFTASLIDAFEQSFTLTDPNTVRIATPVKSTTLNIDPKTGIFTGSFKEGVNPVTVPFAGILIDYEAGTDKSGYGHYLLPESKAATAPIRSASMTLVPAPAGP